MVVEAETGVDVGYERSEQNENVQLEEELSKQPEGLVLASPLEPRVVLGDRKQAKQSVVEIEDVHIEVAVDT